MTVAVCFKCGAFKSGAFNPCEKCGAKPNGYDEMALSMAISDHHFDQQSLERIAVEIQAGRPVPVDCAFVESLKDVVASPIGQRMTGMFQVAMGGDQSGAPPIPPRRDPTRNTASPVPPPSYTPATQGNSGPKGVGGWLLVLCIWTTIISPLFSFAKLHEMGETEMYLGLGLIVFSIISGILLWCGKQVAVVLVRTLLIIILVLNLIGILMLLDQQQPERVTVVLFQSAVPIAWLVYLSVSRRVKATYYHGVRTLP